MGAISAMALTLLNAGDHVVAQRIIYAGTRSLLNETLSRFGVEVTYVAQEDPQAFAAAMQPNTKLVMLETPSNPLLGITDLREVSRIAHAGGALVSVDNTIATPINQRPLEFGADIVIHSATKYLGGHSDLIAGVVAGSAALIDRIWKTHITVGSVLGPIDAWLLLRGLRTLDVRVQQHNRNAMAIAEYLTDHPRIDRVYYPGLASHPQHDLASKQMQGFGGLLSFEVRGTFEETRDIIRRFKLIRTAVSLGGVESLVAQPAAMWPDIGASDEAATMGVTPSLVRLSVGLERDDDLIADLDQALAR
jgi:methionine-gamma-lyase